MLIDSHTHIHFDDFKNEIHEVVERLKDTGVAYLINVGTDTVSNKQCVALAEEYTQIFASVGIHPHEAAKATDDDFQALRRMTDNARVVAIGETGLDYYYEHSPKEVQREVFRKQIKLAQEVKLPIIVHCRDALEECMQILDETQGWKSGGVFHCYPGDLKTAKEIMRKGWYVSFSGIVTFNKALEMQEVARQIPRDRFLIETDAPYLAPVPKRGKRNEPSYVRYVAEKIAELKNVTVEDIARITARNTKELFGLPIDLPGDKAKVAYRIRNSLYLNITNQCTLACKFCPKFDDWMVKGHYLELDHEPMKEEILESVGDPSRYQEIVFCGFGESTLRLDLMKDVAKSLKEKGASRIRLDTEGLANLIYGRNILPELSGLIDEISISLNAPDAMTYAKLCPSRYGEEAYEHVKEFIREAKKHIPDVTATVVGIPNFDVASCKKIVEQELGVKFRLRHYDEVG